MVTPPGPSTDARRTRPRSWRRHAVTAVLLAPAVVLLVVFKIYPLLATIPVSLFDSRGFGTAVTFIGLNNYGDLLSDEMFQRALQNTVLFLIVTTIGVNALGLLFALLVNTPKLKGRAFFQTVLFLPVVISTTATAVLWSFLLDPNIGLIPPIIKLLRLDFLLPGGFYGDPLSAMLTVSIVSIWQSVGFFMIVYLAGLHSIDSELYDAAKVDGAGSMALLTKITLPLLRPFVAVSLTLCIIGGFTVFDLIYIMTGGGPVHSTETLMTYMYFVAFKQFQEGYASALIVFILVVTGLLGLAQQRKFGVQMPKGGR
jgi:ABC-type sugar transport system permease subunit